jgi:hypothetical protein
MPLPHDHGEISTTRSPDHEGHSTTSIATTPQARNSTSRAIALPRTTPIRARAQTHLKPQETTTLPNPKASPPTDRLNPAKRPPSFVGHPPPHRHVAEGTPTVPIAFLHPRIEGCRNAREHPAIAIFERAPPSPGRSLGASRERPPHERPFGCRPTSRHGRGQGTIHLGSLQRARRKGRKTPPAPAPKLRSREDRRVACPPTDLR